MSAETKAIWFNAAIEGKVHDIRACIKTAKNTAILENQQNNHHMMASMLLAKQHGMTTLMLAAKHKRVTCIKALISEGTQLDQQAAGTYLMQQDHHGMTSLMFSAQQGHLTAIKALVAASIAANTHINKQDHHGMTALMFASKQGHLTCVRALIKAHAEINQKNHRGMTALMLAVKHRHLSCVKALLDAGALFNQKNHHGMTALMFAAQQGDLAYMKTLITRGALVNQQNDRGMTALMLAAQQGHLTCVRALMKANAQIDQQDDYGMTALMDAAKNNRIDCVKALINAGANDFQCNRSTLETAYELTLSDDIKAFITRKRLTRIKRLKIGNNQISLSDIVRWGHFDHIDTFIRPGVWIDERDDFKRTALMHAANYSGKTTIVKSLIKAGAQIDQQDNRGMTTLMFAVEQGYTHIIEILLQAGAQIDLKNGSGMTALIMAANEGYPSIIKMLLQADAQIDQQDDYGMTALRIATENSYIECTKLLIEAGADVGLHNPLNETNEVVAQLIIEAKQERSSLVLDANDENNKNYIKQHPMTILARHNTTLIFPSISIYHNTLPIKKLFSTIVHLLPHALKATCRYLSQLALYTQKSTHSTYPVGLQATHRTTLMQVMGSNAADIFSYFEFPKVRLERYIGDFKRLFCLEAVYPEITPHISPNTLSSWEIHPNPDHNNAIIHAVAAAIKQEAAIERQQAIKK